MFAGLTATVTLGLAVAFLVWEFQPATGRQLIDERSIET